MAALRLIEAMAFSATTTNPNATSRSGRRMARVYGYAWHLAVIRAIVHTASNEWQSGRISEAQVELAMLTTITAAIGERAR